MAPDVLVPEVGREADNFGTYDLNQHLRIRLGFGHLFAGQFLEKASTRTSPSYPYAHVDYKY